MALINDEHYMSLALKLASEVVGQTGSNPPVGCVIVKNGRVIGMGAHLKMGEAHAEAHALAMAGDEAEGSTVYVTLEPCSHHGRTPPCSDRLIAGKVSRVVAATPDPNPLVAGKGLARLREHGIETVCGVCEEEAVQLIEPFAKLITKGLPFVTMKTASTLDGKIAAKTGDSKWITGPAARSYVHELRHRHQAIMIGIETLLSDDPQLTTRNEVPSMQPLRVVIDSQLRTPLQARMLHDQVSPVLICTTEQAAHANQTHKKQLEQAGAEVAICGSGDRVDLLEVMKLLADKQISSVLLEGGGRLNGAMLTAGLIDKIILFFAPKIIGGSEAPANLSFDGMAFMADAYKLERVQVTMYGEDVCISGYPRYEGR